MHLHQQTSAGLRELVSENAAQAHLQINLYQRINGSYSGSYTGTIDYGEGVVPWGGIWEFQIDGSGNVIGQSTDEEGYVGSFTGQINSSGTGVSGGSKDGVRYSLTVGAEGNVSGSWSWVDIDDPAFSGGGSLRGSKSQNQSEESSSNNLISDDADVATGESTWPPTSINEITFPSFSEELAVYDNPSLDSEGDQHWWSFSGQDETFFFYVKTGADHQADDNTHMGCVANVFDQNGNLKYAIDPIRYISADDGFHKNCEIIFTPPDSKTYYLRVKASDDYSTKTGSYTLIATRDRHTAYSTAVNQSKTYTVEGSVLNRNYKISRTFTMPDITELYGLFVLITDCQIISASVPVSSLDCPSPAFYDVATGEFVSSGPVGDYGMSLGFGPMFWDRTNLSGVSRLYDWTTLPMYKLTITNPNPLPNYDPDYPYCAEGMRKSNCTTESNAGITSLMTRALFDSYNIGWEDSDAIPLNKSCADFGYSSERSIIKLTGFTTTELQGTCRFSTAD